MREQDFLIEHNNRTGKVSYRVGGEIQSIADANGISFADYIHAMYFFIRRAGAGRVLMIGCGGGTLATMLVKAGICVTAVDVDANAFEIARRYFALPAEVDCHVGDGAAFLRRTHARFDAIALDAYDGDTVPAQFSKAAFFTLAKSRLKPGGVFLMNLMVASDDDRTPDDLARTAQSAFRDVRLLDTDGWIDRNAVLLAGSVRALTRPRLLLKPARGARRLAREIRILDFRPLRG
jgi:SAM-dependent methyltransferase